MGAGKTSVGRALARQLSCEMIDLDDVISEREKRTITELIEELGEAQFREAETAALRFVLENKQARIITLGGGAWTLERNRAALAEHAYFTIWLDAPFELCWERITSEQQRRPLAPDRQSAHQIYRERRPLYELAAGHMRVTENRSADEIASEIVRALRR
jgi:shikimate kinase